MLLWFAINNLLLNGKKTNGVKFTILNVKQTVSNVIVRKEKENLVETIVFLGKS